MSYLTLQEYSDMSINPIDQVSAHFDHYEKEAERIIDKATSGIDNVKKLKVAFPTDADSIYAVKSCMCQLMDALATLDSLNAKMRDAMAEGKSGIIGSVSSGSESISYVTNGNMLSANESPEAKAKYFYNLVHDMLSGIQDAHGVNLLFGGAYPYV